MKVAELKAELTTRDIPIKGMLKAALASKLTEIVSDGKHVRWSDMHVT